MSESAKATFYRGHNELPKEKMNLNLPDILCYNKQTGYLAMYYTEINLYIELMSIISPSYSKNPMKSDL